MLKRLTAVVLFAALAGCGGGSGSSLNPRLPDSATRHVRDIVKSFTYTLGSATYPSGFSPTCGSSLIAFVNYGTVTSTQLSFAGGIDAEVRLGPCHAAAGDSITVTIDSFYGEVKEEKIANGNFFVIDNTQDSGANVTIADNTTGYSLNTQIYYSY